MKKHTKALIDELCQHLGEDLDHPMCKELVQHIQECPECQFYLDTVKMTVNIFRETHKPESVPEDVKKNLLKSLNLQK
ncbi:MAG: hypothetical protein EH225_11930 [Calditrichaeota bacterium]|nr:hypothetical protein [Calditrichota bacterium]RQV99231.1 MAG: hypothetical protein EH225_11930 [Calditrichota bacterium]